MKTVGIICEYNPFHPGHTGHIERTRAALGFDSAVVCVMSGNFVQRGDIAVFNKYARAEAAALCGADLVVELPSPYALSSAEGFASAGIYILDKLGICDFISFGSEAGDIAALKEVSEAIVTEEANTIMKEGLGSGLPYAAAQQNAADAVLGARSHVLRSPNNLLGIEYLKAIAAQGSMLRPMTVKRIGGAHDGDMGYSASAIRAKLLLGERPEKLVPRDASDVYAREIVQGRGPNSMKSYELAMMSRLRAMKDFSWLAGVSEGLDNRLLRYTEFEPTIAKILESVKTKRYAMSRIRRMLICACLGISAADTLAPPSYIKVLAMNRTGMKMLKHARKKTALPIITKPATVKKIAGTAAAMFAKEVAATDFYVLAYRNENDRCGGQEWRETPRIVEDGNRNIECV